MGKPPTVHERVPDLELGDRMTAVRGDPVHLGRERRRRHRERLRDRREPRVDPVDPVIHQDEQVDPPLREPVRQVQHRHPPRVDSTCRLHRGVGLGRTTGGLVTVWCTVETRFVDVGLALLGFGLPCVSHAMTPIAINARSRRRSEPADDGGVRRGVIRTSRSSCAFRRAQGHLRSAPEIGFAARNDLGTWRPAYSRQRGGNREFTPRPREPVVNRVLE